MKKQFFLFLLLPLATMFKPSDVFAADPPQSEYDAAMAAIIEGRYYLVTEVGETKWYVTQNGNLTDKKENACLLAISKVDASDPNGYLFDTAFLIDPGNGTHFSNPTPLLDGKAYLHLGFFYQDDYNDRKSWERQVLYLKDGKFAIRACNTPYGETGWLDAGRVFWTYEMTEPDIPVPCYSYKPAYVWTLDSSIPYADTNVKAICVDNWDTNNDGELSYTEAAAVTDLGEVFRYNTTITSFDELQYFTGLANIGVLAFSKCTGLTSITIPNSVMTIDNNAFDRCSGLTSITIPNSVTSIGRCAFEGCSGLTSITISGSVTSIGEYAFRSCSGLTSITIPNSVTSIGLDAFYGCSGLTSIMIPNSVTSIDWGAFGGCTNLTTIVVEEGNTIYDSRNNCNAIIETSSNKLIVGCKNTTIPNSVTSIGNYAFDRCSGLTSVTIPNSVTAISRWAFYRCSGLTSITIPNSVTSIEWGAFAGCTSLTSIAVEEGNTTYDSRNNCNAIIETSSNTLIAGCKNSTIPSSVTNIGSRAFSDCTSLISVTIPSSVTSIGAWAFHRCTGLTSIAIPNSVTSIGESAFYECSGLTSVTNSNSVTSIGRFAFSDCIALTFITIPNSVTSIGEYAFQLCSSLTSIKIPNSVTSIGEYAFSNCSSLTSVTVMASQPLPITEFTFSNRGNATLYVPAGSKAAYEAADYWKEFKEIIDMGQSIAFADANVKALCVANWDTNNDGELSYAEAVAVTDLGTVFKSNQTITSFDELQYFTGLENISDCAFYACDALTVVNIPLSVISIGYSAFSNCSGLTSITIPGSVTDIGNYAFCRCSDLASITIPGSVTSIGKYAFYQCFGLTSITITDGVTSIGEYAFCDCYGLTSVNIPKSVTSIGEEVFMSCNLFSVVVEEGNTVYDSREGCNAIIETASNTLIQGCNNTIIPVSVTSIGYSAFLQCYNLTSIIIPNNVTSIGHYAFSDCTSLTSITIPSSVTNIGVGAFSGCSALTSIAVEEGNIVYDSREGCNAIIETASNTLIQGCKNTTIPASVTSIGNQAFELCRELTSVTIPAGVTSIGDYAFKNCSGLTSITIPNSVTTIGYEVFRYCTNLISITIPNSVTEIGGNAFHSTAWLNNQPDGMVYAGKVAYSYKGTMPDNTTINIIEGTLGIAGWAFSDCRGLTSIAIPNSVTNIGDWAFRNCIGLTTIAIPANVTSIGDYAFSISREWTSVKVGMKTPVEINANTFGWSCWNATLYVPQGSKAAYEAADYWKVFKEIIECNYVDVENQILEAGNSTTMEINVNNFETNLVGFQMDLTLPESIGIENTGCALSSRITDEEQQLTINKLEDGKYRLTSTSLSLIPINGNDGTLLTLKLTAEDGCIGGQATISNILFSTPESGEIIMDDESFGISIQYNLTYEVDDEEYKTFPVVYGTTVIPEDEPTKEGYTFSGWSEVPETMPAHDVVIMGRFYLYGDVNTDEEVDVVDVVDVARYVVATPSVKFREKLADLNYDNTVNIADAVVLVNYIAGNQNFVKAITPSSLSYDYDQCELQLLSSGQNALSLCLNGEADFTAFQFEVDVPEGTDISAIHIDGMRKDGHQLLYNKVSENCYRVAALSLSNATFKGSEGELLNITINGLHTNDACIHDIHFVTTNGTDITFDALYISGTETGRANVNMNESDDVIYDIFGRKLSRIQHGLNIVNGKKVVVK